MNKQHGWAYVWREDGICVSKIQIFASAVDNWWLVRMRINRQLKRPELHPFAQASVVARVKLQSNPK